MRGPEDIIDEGLVLQAQMGDRGSLNALANRWYDRLRWYALQTVGRPDQAADAVQEAWMAVVKGLGRLRDPAAFRSWVYRLVTCKCADQVRRRQRRREVDVDALPLDAAPEVDSGEVPDSLRRAIAVLPVAQRQVLILHHLDELPVAEIARVLDVPAGTVKSRLHHARQNLKSVLERRSP